MVGLLQLFHAHILPYVDVAKEVTARMFGRLGKCVDDILPGMKGPFYSKKRIQEKQSCSYQNWVFYNSTRVRKLLDHFFFSFVIEVLNDLVLLLLFTINHLNSLLEKCGFKE